MLASSLNERVNQTFHLLENLLNWAKTQMRGKHINPQAISMYVVAQSTTELLRQIALDKGIRLHNHVNPKDKLVIADKDMMNLILRNLIANSIKFTAEGGEISVHSEPMEGFFKDYGC